MTRTEELLALAEAALEREPLDVNEDLAIYGSTSWSRVQRSFIAAANPETIKQLVELAVLQNEALKYARRYIEREWNYPTSVNNAIAAFERFEKGGESIGITLPPAS